MTLAQSYRWGEIAFERSLFLSRLMPIFCQLTLQATDNPVKVCDFSASMPRRSAERD
jgi:hypothetical protein